MPSMKKLIWLLFFCSFFGLAGCDRNNNLSLFSYEEDIMLGKQLNEEILNRPDQYPILNPEQYPQAYQYLSGILEKILESGEVNYQEEFPWQIYIIQDDSTLNAFATPGGYIYVYSGLIKYLEKEDDLAGVLAHEIAHADLRHSTRQLQKAYGLNLILSLALGEGGSVAEQIIGKVVGDLSTLSFSRQYEKEADLMSVEYLAGTPYQCDAAKSFFLKLREKEEAQGFVPTFLSTHPNPDNRIEAIENKGAEINCQMQPFDPASYQEFQQSLP